MERIAKDWQAMRVRLDAIELTYAQQTQGVECPPPYTEKPLNSPMESGIDLLDSLRLDNAVGQASIFSRPVVVKIGKICTTFYQTVQNSISRLARPRLRAGYRRIEWTCVGKGQLDVLT